MPEPSTARALARAELTRRIKEEALRQLAASGADLSLRAISRELGMVSSALYRYFPSRDDLLTALIIDAYADLADALEAVDAPDDPLADRWVAVSEAMRSWATRQPHRFQLIYGTPVPGYRAPRDTTVPAERVMVAFFAIVTDAAGHGRFAHATPPAGIELRTQLETVAEVLGGGMPPAAVARTVAGMAQVIGMISLELGGHFVGGFEPADALFSHSVRELAGSIGL